MLAGMLLISGLSLALSMMDLQVPHGMLWGFAVLGVLHGVIAGEDVSTGRYFVGIAITSMGSGVLRDHYSISLDAFIRTALWPGMSVWALAWTAVMGLRDILSARRA